jgi:hypothetical protein
MTVLYVIGAVVLIVAVRVVIKLVIRSTVNAAARPIEKALQNRSIQNESDRIAQRLQAEQNMNGQRGNPPYDPRQYPNYQPPNGQYGSPQYGSPQYGSPQYGSPQYGSPQQVAPQQVAPQQVAPQWQWGAPQHRPSDYRNNQP